MSRSRSTALALATGTLLTAALAGPAVAVPQPAFPGPAAAAGSPALTGGSTAVQSYVVRAVDTALARDAVHSVGGTVDRHLPIIDGVSAHLAPGRVAALRAVPGVRAVTADVAVQMLGRPGGQAADLLGYDPVTTTGSLYTTAKLIGAHDSYKDGYTGKGIGVALIDSGVSPVEGLTSGNVVNGPDLSFESQDPETTNKDTFGHGTHMASIIAGRDVEQARPSAYVDATRFNGVAPDARLVSLKMAAHDGAVDVSQIIAAINWVTEHADDPELNIRVLNLSFGTDGVQEYDLDPLSYAAEQAWRAGIVVVVAAGNDGTAKVELANPALNPHLLAVGADDTRGTARVSDDVVAAFSNRGTARRKVDVLAPGVSIHGLRVPGAHLDEAHPTARVGSRFFKGSGTSQAAAVVSGATALLLQRHPHLTPDQVKDLFERTAQSLPSSQANAGRGLIDVDAAQAATPSQHVPGNRAPATGLGSLEAARGSSHVADCDDRGTCVELVGEQDVMANAWNPAQWAPQVAGRQTWDSEGRWNGSVWGGSTWGGSSWARLTWAGRSWTGRSWTGRSWTGRSWTGRSWTSTGWSDGTWSGRSWTGRSWTSGVWAGGAWD